MGDVIKVGEIKVCRICKKKQAKFLCDMPNGRFKNMHIKKENGITDYENSFKWETSTCDVEVCEKCAIEIGNDIHFCKRCIERLKNILN